MSSNNKKKTNVQKNVTVNNAKTDKRQADKKETVNIQAENKEIKNKEINNKETNNKEIKNTESKNTDLKKSEPNNIEQIKNAEENKETEKSKTAASINDKNDKKSDFSKEHLKAIAVAATKIVLPVAAGVLVIAAIVSLAGKRNEKAAQDAMVSTQAEDETASVLLEEPLLENEYPEVNQLMQEFYQSLATGDVETIRTLKDYTDDTELITYEKKSEFIESYSDIVCYTKDGTLEGTYYVYVSYNVKFKDIETVAPGLNTWYVYTNDSGVLQIDGDMDENITATLKLVTNQDDVVDLFNKVDVRYNEAVAQDETLNTFLTELPNQIKTSVGVALAQLETENNDTQQVAEASLQEETQPVSEETSGAPTESQEVQVSQVVNQQVKTTDTVNVRASDSEQADKLGKAQKGEVLTRVEEKLNGWSKVIYNDKEAYIKSDYLEVVSTQAVEESIGTIKAKTNVNVRNAASQTADRIGVAQEGNIYNLLENQGEWLKIDYNGQTGYVKTEFFE